MYKRKKKIRKKPEENRDRKGRFKPGNTVSLGAGRPKGSISLVKILKEKLQEISTTNKKKTVAEVLIDKLISSAIKGNNIKAMKDIIDRIDGKPTQTTRVGNIEGETISLVIGGEEDEDDTDEISESEEDI